MSLGKFGFFSLGLFSAYSLSSAWAGSDFRMGLSIDRAPFAQIRAGSFMMGSPVTEKGRYGEDLHPVVLSRDFEMQTTEVTQLQWVQVMGANPSQFSKKEFCPDTYLESQGVGICPRHPVENVSWVDVQTFLHQVNSISLNHFYRLPTEAEWEYAARAGTTTAFSFGASVDELGQHAWFNENSSNQTHAVASKKPNAFGLYDMHGNVYEWVQDWYAMNYSPAGQKNPVIDPVGPVVGQSRVIRSGSWYSYPLVSRSAARNYEEPIVRRSYVGFRTVRVKK